jgi:transcriptional regulator with XRE-family HTH domain
MSTPKNISGQKIRRLRMARGLSVEELSIRMERCCAALSASQITRIETRARRVIDRELCAFGKALGVSVSRLLGSRS